MRIRKSNDILDTVLAELESVGAKILDVEKSKHFKLHWKLGAAERTTVMAITPGCRRSLLNTRAFVRRQIRELRGA